MWWWLTMITTAVQRQWTVTCWKREIGIRRAGGPGNRRLRPVNPTPYGALLGLLPAPLQSEPQSVILLVAASGAVSPVEPVKYMLFCLVVHAAAWSDTVGRPCSGCGRQRCLSVCTDAVTVTLRFLACAQGIIQEDAKICSGGFHRRIS